MGICIIPYTIVFTFEIFIFIFEGQKQQGLRSLGTGCPKKTQRTGPCCHIHTETGAGFQAGRPRPFSEFTAQEG